jgi:hypothetical protein
MGLNDVFLGMAPAITGKIFAGMFYALCVGPSRKEQCCEKTDSQQMSNLWKTDYGYHPREKRFGEALHAVPHNTLSGAQRAV